MGGITLAKTQTDVLLQNRHFKRRTYWLQHCCRGSQYFSLACFPNLWCHVHVMIQYSSFITYCPFKNVLSSKNHPFATITNLTKWQCDRCFPKQVLHNLEQRFGPLSCCKMKVTLYQIGFFLVKTHGLWASPLCYQWNWNWNWNQRVWTALGPPTLLSTLHSTVLSDYLVLTIITSTGAEAPYTAVAHRRLVFIVF